MMNRVLLACCLCVTLAGCRQPDGPLPAAGPDDENRQHDLSRDLQNIAGGDANGPAEFAADLKVLAGRADAPWEPADSLGNRLSAALKGKALPEESAAQLARFFWIAAAGRELSERQVEKLGEDIGEALKKVGAADSAAAAVGEQVAALQGAVTRKERKWYQLF